jgi:hypothetical protein
MTTRLLRLLPVVAMLASALSLAGATEPSLLAGAILAAASVVLAVAIVAVRAPMAGAVGGVPGDRRPLLDARPAPSHPGTPGRARPRAPGRGLVAASS